MVDDSARNLVLSEDDGGPANDAAREAFDPQPGRVWVDPIDGKVLIEPTVEDEQPVALALAVDPTEVPSGVDLPDDRAGAVESTTASSSDTQDSRTSTTTRRSSTASTPSNTSSASASTKKAATTSKPASNSSSTTPTTAKPASNPSAKKTTTTTTKKPATTTTAKPATTTTTAKPATTTTAKPATTTTKATPAPASGQGCYDKCTKVGYQDLRNASDITLQDVYISNPNGRCIDLSGARNVTLRNVTIKSCGTSAPVNGSYDAGLINIENASNITIVNSIIEDISAERFGSSRNNAIQIRSSKNITITGNTIRDVHSNIAEKSNDHGNRSIKIEGSTSHIKIDGNRFTNAGRNAVQINRVRNAPGISITNNIIEGRGRWDSDYEDMINLYSASGTANDPIRIANNTLRNGGPSTSGTGIILGDGNTSSGPTQYVIAEGNTMTDPGHVGINLAGGTDITIRNNVIVGRGNVPHKTTTGFTVNHFGYSNECKNHVVSGNRVWMDNQHLPSGVNHTWIPDTCTQNVKFSGNTFGDSSLR